MKVCILYRSNSEHERTIKDFVRDFRHAQTDRAVELLDLNTREGASMASLYVIVEYPAILAMSSDGQLVKTWIGETMPLMNEVAYYTHI